VGVFADPIALRPFLGTERDLLELLPRHDAWLAADPGATDLCRQLGWRDQVSAWQLRIDPRAQDVTWTADPEQPTVRIPMWVDSLAFASRRASATIVVPVPPRPQPDAVELTRRILADLGPEDVVLHGHVAPSPLEEVAGRATTHVGHLSL